MTWIMGVDVGGTFTDAMLVDPESGEIRRAKVLTTVDDQSVGVLSTFDVLGVLPRDLDLFCHGTTVGINAFLERRGSKTGLICTQGTRDLIEMGRLQRNSLQGLYDPDWKRPQQSQPLIQRRHIREVSERVLYDGTVHVKMDDQAVRRELEFLRDEGIEAVAVCLLNSYVNSEHEDRILELVKEILPRAYVQSSAFRPVVGEYARTVGMVIDAYTGPTVSRYLARLQEALTEAGYRGVAVIMQVNGGVRTLQRTAESFPAYTLESGPVAGMLGAEYYGRNFGGGENLICIDIGGTSVDLGLVMDGKAQSVDNWEVEWSLPLGVPAIDVRSIGAGGGSVISVDEIGTLRVGPESAGAEPGPAAYGKGGTRPTITDAHVVLGALRPEAFLDGRMRLDEDAAREALASVGAPLGMSAERLAAEAIRIMNSSVEAEITKMVFERGVDLRSFSLFCFGGAGGLHAGEIARIAGIRDVIIPQAAGGFSALGLVTAPPKVERAISRVVELRALEPKLLEILFDRLEVEATQDLVDQGVVAGDIEIVRSLYGMYAGQSFSNELNVDAWPPDLETLDQWRAGFDKMYDRLYGYSAPEIEVVITTLRVVASGSGREFRAAMAPSGGEAPPADALCGSYGMSDGEGTRTAVPFYRRGLLRYRNVIRGPAVIEDEGTTILVPGDAEAVVDMFGNIRLSVHSSAVGNGLNVPAVDTGKEPRANDQ